MTKHTTAPWEYDATLKYYNKRVIRHNGVIIASIFDVVAFPYDEPQREANARLIAAAPELLEALKDIQHNAQVMNKAEPNPVWTAIDNRCRAVIAKAEGEGGAR